MCGSVRICSWKDGWKQLASWSFSISRTLYVSRCLSCITWYVSRNSCIRWLHINANFRAGRYSLLKRLISVSSGMQEVTENIYAIFQQSSWWKQYQCSVNPDSVAMRGYFCMQVDRFLFFENIEDWFCCWASYHPHPLWTIRTLRVYDHKKRTKKFMSDPPGRFLRPLFFLKALNWASSSSHSLLEGFFQETQLTRVYSLCVFTL